jgi:hypothetical protein
MQMSSVVQHHHRNHEVIIYSREVPQCGWIADVVVTRLIGKRFGKHAFTCKAKHSLATQDAAMAGARQQAIQWIDSQLLSSSD